VFVNAYPWDTTAYHLHFTARFFQISDLTGINHLLPERYEGFPKLWRLVLYPGLELRMPRLFLICNFLALAILCVAVNKIMHMPWWLTCCSVLCFPISMEGFRSSYQDFSTNTFVAAGAICFACGTSSGSQTYKWKRINLGLLLLALAANIKFQGLFMAIIVLASSVAWALAITINKAYRNKRIMSNSKCKIRSLRASVAFAPFLVVVILAQPIWNSIFYSNPFYPVKAFGLNGNEPTYSTPIQYIPDLPIITNLLGFYSSAFEIDPIVRGESGWAFKRSLEGAQQVKKQYFRPGGAGLSDIRTGGSNGFSFFVLSAVAWLSICRSFSGCKREADAVLAAKLMTSVVLMAMLPQSMELRYFLAALYLTVLVALRSPYLILSRIALVTVILGMGFSIKSVFLDAPAPDLHLITEQRCYELGRLEINRIQGTRVLLMPKQKVANKLPFQCRMSMDTSTVIDYSD